MTMTDAELIAEAEQRYEQDEEAAVVTIRNCPHCGGDHYGSIECPCLEPCVVCGDKTILACSDCAIDAGGKGESVHVCAKPECRDTHEAKHAKEPIR